VLHKLIVAAIVTAAVGACATLENLRGLMQAPRFEHAPGQQADIRRGELRGIRGLQ
jgi:hypothetical protein